MPTFGIQRKRDAKRTHEQQNEHKRFNLPNVNVLCCSTQRHFIHSVSLSSNSVVKSLQHGMNSSIYATDVNVRVYLLWLSLSCLYVEWERERANAVRMKLLLVFSCVRANCTLCTPHKVIIDVVHSTTGFTHSHMRTMIYVLRGAHKEFVSQSLWVCAFLFSFLNILKVCIWAIHGHNHLSNISSC